MNKILLTIILATLAAGYIPIPAPIIPPTKDVPYDPNLAPYNIGSYVVRENTLLNTEGIFVYTDDTNSITISSTTLQFSKPFKRDNEWVFPWSFQTSRRGLSYNKLTVMDKYGTKSADVTINVVGAPIITGCHKVN